MGRGKGEERKGFPFKKLRGIILDPLCAPLTTLYTSKSAWLSNIFQTHQPLLPGPMHHHHPVEAESPKWSPSSHSFLLKMHSPWTSHSDLLFFFNKFYLFIYLFFGCVGSSLLHTAFSSCSEQGLLIAVVSLVAEHRL